MATEQIDLSVTPYKVAEGTYVVPQLLEAPPVGYFYLNSLVIQAKEPVIVDTGTVVNRDQWLKHVFSIVDPTDVRWIFLSHDDRDHSGNLMQVLEACPNATLITTWFGVGRMAEEWELPMPRLRFVRDGESFEAGDRTLTAIRPPLFDSPITRGLFDAKTGVYWSVDTFATNVPHPVEDTGELDDAYRRDGWLLGARLVSPWHQWLDARKWLAHVDRVQRLPIEAIATCHGPVLRGRHIQDAFEVVRTAPDMEPWQEFSQQDLESWLDAAGA